MSIQRNAIVAPFSVNSPLLDSQKNDLRKAKESGSAPGQVSITHQKWFQEVANGINATVQLSSKIPAHSNSPGQPGTLVPFSGGFYFCVGSNSWLKFIGAIF